MNIFNRIPFPFQFESVRYFSHSLNHPLFIYIYQLTCMVSNYHSDFLKIKNAGELVISILQLDGSEINILHT